MDKAKIGQKISQLQCVDDTIRELEETKKRLLLGIAHEAGIQLCTEEPEQLDIGWRIRVWMYIDSFKRQNSHYCTPQKVVDVGGGK